MPDFKAKAKNKNSVSIILKFSNLSLNPHRSKEWTGDVLKYAHDKWCHEISGVQGTKYYAILIGFSTVEASL